ncbi:MAG: phosphoribosylanthranilate isomerase [Acidobacteriota bacterium]|nr:phosphoribosylanthranilate isomerase [Acidobacteriota bacterium]
MWIKICASTNLEDAQLAAQLGADAVGFVFAPSSRRVTPAQVARITQHLPKAVERVGVFAAVEPDQIALAARTARLDTVQLHGLLNLDLLRRLRTLLPRRIKLIQALHWTVDANGSSAIEIAHQLRTLAASNLAARILIDSKLGESSGGTGIPFDWAAARTIFSEASAASADTKLILAGGLRPQNVAQAIQGLAPWGVDVATGVESSPGRKSPEKLAAFIAAARKTQPATSEA